MCDAKACMSEKYIKENTFLSFDQNEWRKMWNKIIFEVEWKFLNIFCDQDQQAV